MKVPSNNARGFTLIELLIAMAVFAVMSMMAYEGLQAVMNTRQQTDAQAERLQAVQMAFLYLQRDLNFITLRRVRDEFGDQQAPFKLADIGLYRLELTRDGIRNPARLPRSSLQRVAYSLEEETQTLWRLRWGVLDRAPDTLPVKQRLLNNVEAITLRVLDDNKEWHTQWPLGGVTASLPRAVEVSLDLTDWGRLSRVFLLPEAE